MSDLNADSRTGSDSAMPVIASVAYCSVDEMREASEAAGWTINYEQIGPGELTASTRLAEFTDISLMDESTNRRLEFHGETPVNHVTVLVPCAGSEIWANGDNVRDQQLLMINPGSELLGFSSENCRVLSMHVPVSLLHSMSTDLRASVHSSAWETNTSIQLGDSMGRILRQLMRFDLYEPAENGWQREQTSQLVSFLVAAVSRSNDKAGKIYCKGTPKSGAKVVSRACEYIEFQLKRPLTMSDLASCCAVSLTKLERSFKRELSLTPTAYIRARRLQAARRDLQKIRADHGQVARIATDYGFNHLGRFAALYRRQFGELPSETLST